MITKDRLEREKQTLQIMFHLYCHRQHGGRSKLCKECQVFLDYSLGRLALCRYGASKTVCARCPVHCYKPEMRVKIKQVMRSTGPIMLLAHPILTILHFLDSLQKKPGIS
jgi:hypothetical protein